MDNEATRRRRRAGPSSSLTVKSGGADEGINRITPRRKVRKRKRKNDNYTAPLVMILFGALLLMLVLIGYAGYRRVFPTRTKETAPHKAFVELDHVKVKHEIPFSHDAAHHLDQFHRRPIPVEIAKPEKQIICDDDSLSEYLHEQPVDGMHVLCVGEGTSVGRLEITYYPGAQLDKRQETMSERSWHGIRDSLQSALQLRTAPNDQYQPWAIFTPTGDRIVGQEDPFDEDSKESLEVAKSILDSGLVLLMEGGQWIWPGVRPGFKRVVNLHSILPEVQKEERTVVLETLSLRPLVLSVEGFLSNDECDYIKEQAAPKVKYSSVVLMDKDKGRPASDFRTSQSTFLSARDDALKGIDYRTASLVRIPRSHQETLQVLRYGEGEKYNAHHDYFDPTLYKNDPATLQMIQNGKRNRLVTVFWYLSNVIEGGETLFPRWNGAPHPVNPADCSYGLRVKPVRGNVIIFYSATPGGNPDPLSLHAACPVKEGVKWAANKWVWNSPMKYIKE